LALADIVILFIDLSFIKFVGEYFHNSSALSFTTQLLSYFSGESQLMNDFLYQTLFQPNKNFSERFLIYQINQLRSLRQSSTSAKITRHLIEFKIEAEKGISMAKKFWVNPAVEKGISIFLVKLFSFFQQIT
jgi:hypothetical protein